MIILEVTPKTWVSVSVVAVATVIVWIIVIFFVLPWLEKRSRQRQEDKNKRRRRQSFRRIELPGEKMKVDYHELATGNRSGIAKMPPAGEDGE